MILFCDNVGEIPPHLKQNILQRKNLASDPDVKKIPELEQLYMNCWDYAVMVLHDAEFIQ
jgi:hypothetical protein